METQLNELKTRLIEINDLESATALMHWDQSTYMPPGGSDARARQVATLSQIAHEKFIDPAIGKLLEELQPYEASLPFDSNEASLLRVARRDYERATKVPAQFMAELNRHISATYPIWAQARADNNFSLVQAPLEKTLDLSRQYAEFFPGYEHRIDPLIDWFDYGMSAATLRPLFADLRAQLVPLVQTITAQAPADDACLQQHISEAEQLAFGVEVIKRLGYDFERGRQDKTHHPFMIKFSIGDVRITTRVKENDFREALFSTIHESGHAMYEQGVRQELEGTPLAGGASAGVHESQSRLWENIVGRSRGFWEFYYPKLQAAFHTQFGAVSLDTFYRAINKVERSLIRTDADEVTYNLHVIIRFDFELDLLEGRLAVRDLPEAWRERYTSDLGITPPDDSDGVLQDSHWYTGVIGGMFQGYTLGNVLSAQFFQAATRQHPSIEAEIAKGEFGTLHRWLKESLYQHGRKYTPAELVEQVAGGPLSVEPYLHYLRRKYGELYTL